MATEIMSDLDITYPNWPKVLLNDTKELKKKQSKNSNQRYSRRLFSKLKNSPTPYKARSKPAFYQRYMAKPKTVSSSPKIATKKSKQNIGSEWKKEYDVWNMIVQALDQSLLDNHKVNWINKAIGIRDSADKIRLIQNREELQQQILVDSMGFKTHLKDLLNANDSTDDISVKMKFKLVPVVESIILVNKSTETPYMFSKDDNEINNNDMQCTNNEHKIEEEEDETLINYDNNDDNTVYTTCSNTPENLTCSTWEYTEFCSGILPIASSTFISNEHISYLSYDEQSIPLLNSPNRYVLALNFWVISFIMNQMTYIALFAHIHSKQTLDSKTFFDSPIPCFAKKRQIPDEFEPGLHDLQQIMEHCKNARTTLKSLYEKVIVIEDKCISWLRQQETDANCSMSGIDFLSDSVEL